MYTTLHIYFINYSIKIAFDTDFKLDICFIYIRMLNDDASVCTSLERIGIGDIKNKVCILM